MYGMHASGKTAGAGLIAVRLAGGARRITAARDAGNAALRRKHYGIELGAGTRPFNIVLDVNNMMPEQAVDRILELIGAGKEGV